MKKEKLTTIALFLVCVLLAASLLKGLIYTSHFAKGVTHQFSSGDSVCVIDYEIMGRDMSCYAKGEK